jgi:signal peptidase
MLISGEFRYRAIVIATESMTGEINKGDAIVYEEYGEQYVEEQDVLVFLKNGNRIVHRVVSIERVNGENRYYTKGDANDAMDAGYITDADIEGIVLFKMPYVGNASLWLRDAFKK